MKYTIMGFDQKAVLGLTKEVTTENGKKEVLRLDTIDAIILRWIADFYPNMKKYTEGNNEYAWVYYKTLLEDNPTMQMCKRTLRRRLIKMTYLGILTHKHIKTKGSYSYYGFGENYVKLLRNENVNFDSSKSEINSDVENENLVSYPLGHAVQTPWTESPNKDSTFIYSSIKSSKERKNDVENLRNKKRMKKKNKNKEYRHLFGSFDDIISFYSNGNRTLKLKMEDFVQMRYAIGRKLSYPSLVGIFSRLDNLSSDNDFAKLEILDKSIRNSWADVFPLNQEEWEESWKHELSYLRINNPQEYELRKEQYYQGAEFKCCGG